MSDHERVAGDPTATATPTVDQDTTDGTDSGTRTQGDDTSTRSIGKDDAFHILQNSRRRAVLRYLLARPDREQFRMRDLAEAVAAWEHDTTVRQLVSDERQRVYIALYQSHLPKLDNHGIIDYNQPRGIVEPTPLIGAPRPVPRGGPRRRYPEPDRRRDGLGSRRGGHTSTRGGAGPLEPLCAVIDTRRATGHIPRYRMDRHCRMRSGRD